MVNELHSSKRKSLDSNNIQDNYSSHPLYTQPRMEEAIKPEIAYFEEKNLPKFYNTLY